MQCEGLGMNTQNMRLALKIKAVRVQRIAANITFVIGVMENKKTLFMHALLSIKFHHLNMRSPAALREIRKRHVLEYGTRRSLVWARYIPQDTL